MRFPVIGRLAAAMSLVVVASAATAQSIPAGTYAMPDTGYSIIVKPKGEDLSVIEAGQERTYVKVGPGTYEYRSNITNATYQLLYRDRASVAALKKDSGSAPTLLVRNGGPAPEPAAAPAAAPMQTVDPSFSAPATSDNAPASNAASPHLKVAERYQALTLTDKKDVQTWAFCSAAALKRSMASKDEADAYGREAAERLSSISVDPARNPCPDAIPNDLWPGANNAEAEALAQANAAQLAAAAQQSREIAAMRKKQAADQKAYEQAQAEHQAALAKARQEQEVFARQQAAYQAALAEHERLTKGKRPASDQ